MPRRVRELVDDGIYHVFNRGNGRMVLFRDKQDFTVFKNKLHEIKEELNVAIYHYCLMANHFHLLLKVSKGQDLIEFMHRVQLGYARYFVKKYEFVGHVFQERFRSPRIREDSYYIQCGRYIERNPVKAGLVSEAESYGESSASFYSLGTRNDLVTPNMFYAGMGSTEEERRQSYRIFLKVEEPYADMIDSALTRA